MASPPTIEKLCPIWPTRDIPGTERFYAALGFRTVYRDDPEGYLILKRDMAELHFYGDAAHEPARSNHGGYMRPQDLDGLSDEWAGAGLPAAGIPRFVAAEDKPWGMRELALIDPNGHLIRAGIEIEGEADTDG